MNKSELKPSKAKRGSAARAMADYSATYSRAKAYDREHDSIVAEFAGLDLTETEQAQVVDVLRMRAGNTADQRRARMVLSDLRKGLKAALVATAEFERSKGEVVDKFTDAGVLRICSRDGLAWLYTAGKITRRQLDGGLAYRARYELAFKGLKSQLDASVGGAPMAMIQQLRLRRARGEAQRIAVELRVAMTLKATPRALSLLRRVAGDGFTMTSQVGSGKAVALGVKALAMALDICADMLPQDQA